MTQTADDLVKRLESCYISGNTPIDTNPDGREAAARIRELEAQLKAKDDAAFNKGVNAAEDALTGASTFSDACLAISQLKRT